MPFDGYHSDLVMFIRFHFQNQQFVGNGDSKAHLTTGRREAKVEYMECLLGLVITNV